MVKEYELKLATGKTVIWEGRDGGTAAAQNYADSHPGSAVIAWRDYPRHGFFPSVSARQIIG